MNCVTLTGRLTQEPETRINNNGTKIATFNLAVRRNYKSADGAEADFIRIVCYNKLAELVDLYTYKGMLVAINGRINTGSATRQDGSKSYFTNIVADQVEFLSTKAERNKNDNYNMSKVEIDDGVNSYDLTDSDIEF